MNHSSGVAAMVRAAVWCEEQLGLEVLSIGRAADSPEDCILELCGRHLAYRFALRGGWVWLYASLLDAAAAPELLLNAGDGLEGWRRLCVIVRMLEREKVRSLAKPIELGGALAEAAT